MSDDPTPMEPSERELFVAALGKDPEERASFLDAECRGDPILKRRIEALLNEHRRNDLVDSPAGGLAVRSGGAAWNPGELEERLAALKPEEAGETLGPYKLLEHIGEGGFGIVWMAQQERPVRRRVALKIIKMGMDTREVIARFEQERQALAMMDHPNIAKVFDAGATPHGRPFFVMELVRGIAITSFCDQAKLSTRERLNLFITVCQAVQHAHQKGVIHRDIKPSNVLVTNHDGVPVPKVIDFGVAKATQQRLTEMTLFTKFEQMIGTPLYMSPEQAELSGIDVDTRSDIYSLGILLYELLTGRTPIDAGALKLGTFDEVRRMIREEEAARPSFVLKSMAQDALFRVAQSRDSDQQRLIQFVRGDLDWIVMKALEKDRSRRYATANDLALDIQRTLSHEPILARPPAASYRLGKLLRRHRGAFAAAAAILLTLVAGVLFSTYHALRARHAEQRAVSAQKNEVVLRQQAEQERERAKQHEEVARLNAYVADSNLAHQSLNEGNYGRAFQLLSRNKPIAGKADNSTFEWRYLWRIAQGDEHLSFPPQGGAVTAVASSPDGVLIAAATDEKINIYDARLHALRMSLPTGGEALAFSPDGTQLATATRFRVQIWNVVGWSQRTVLEGVGSPVAFSRDGTQLAAASREGVRIFSVAHGTATRLLPETSPPFAFSPAGDAIATDTPSGVKILSLGASEPEIVLEDSVQPPLPPWARKATLLFSPDGRSIVGARNSASSRGVFMVSIWDPHTGRELAVLPGSSERVEHTGVISSLVFSPDGATLMTASFDHSIRLWDFATRQHLRTVHGHRNEVWSAAFLPDGAWVVSGARDGGLNLWPTRRPVESDVITGEWIPLAISSKRKKLAAANRSGSVAIFNLATEQPAKEYELSPLRRPFQRSGPGGPPPDRGGPPSRFFPPPLAITSDLTLVARAAGDRTVELVNTDTGDKKTIELGGDPLDFLGLSPDGTLLLTAGRGKALGWQDLQTGATGIIAADARRAFFSADGTTLAVLQRENSVQVWDVATRARRHTFVIDPPAGFGCGLSADGALLATTGGRDDFDNAIRLWHTATGRLVGTFTGHKQGVGAVAFSPDGRTLASGSDDSTLKLWNVATQQELLTVRRIGGSLIALLFSPDGTWLVGANRMPPQGELRLYRAPASSE